MFRYRISFSKGGPARFMSHLDMIRTFERAVRRAGLPVSMSQGFNPHSKLAFGFPLPVGVSGLEEYADIELENDISPEIIVKSLGPAMPQGLKVTGACRLEDKSTALMAEVERATYLVRPGIDQAPGREAIRKCLEDLTGLEELPVTRRKKDGREALFDIRPGIYSLQAGEDGEGVFMSMELASGSSLNVRPGEVISAARERCGLFGEGCHLEITRTGMRGPGGKELFDCGRDQI